MKEGNENLNSVITKKKFVYEESCKKGEMKRGKKVILNEKKEKKSKLEEKEAKRKKYKKVDRNAGNEGEGSE